jgi:hypothetical protein
MMDRYLIRQAARPPGTPSARLETDLHHRLADRRLNLVNTRREFFRAKPAEVRDILIRLDASIVEWIDEPQALEWRQSQQARRELTACPGPQLATRCSSSATGTSPAAPASTRSASGGR